ncbi:MAG: hypothetical protein HC902_06395 [Calothrix sp. SM1_5_4]|nr:hypothetical protein [Calothrix sp. SM1_5_4]
MKYLFLPIFMLSVVTAHAKLPYDIVEFQAHSNGGTALARTNFTVYFVRDTVVNGKLISIAGIQSNFNSIVETPDENTSKVLTDADMEPLRKLLEATFSPVNSRYEIKSSDAVCGSVPNPILNFSVKGPPAGNNGAIGCPEQGISSDAAAVLAMIDRIVKDGARKSLKEYRAQSR